MILRICYFVLGLFTPLAGFALELPGAPPLEETLQARLHSVLQNYRQQGNYKPRSHHLTPQGLPRYNNRLLLETSPYLLQHAHNPVNWYPWSKEALNDARRLNRPILLSIGYSTCHWCHVMERESFEDLEIAQVLNENYITIKVDREERPDIDSLYMNAAQLLQGRGGWPLTVWLMPDGTPFYADTYIPARDGDRGAQTGFLTFLRVISSNYQARPDEIANFASQIKDALQKNTKLKQAETLAGVDVLERAAGYYKNRFDPFHGGVEGAPKFPSSLPIRFLLREARRSGDKELLEMATLTLESMAAGGIYDHLGGGFHRYSVDAEWHVPHFEIMLYDNALHSSAYLEAYQITGNEKFAMIARMVLEYIQREMTAPGGGFYSATDADSSNPQGHLEEGWFFTWTPAEVDAVLTEQQARVFKTYYGITESGDVEGRNVLHVNLMQDEVAQQLDIDSDTMMYILMDARQRLFAARTQRPKPALDDKILVSWNALMISAFAQAGRILHETAYIEQAQRAAHFILTHMRREGRLYRSYKDAQLRHNAYLDDYAFFIAALLDLYEASSELRWMEEAVSLQAILDKHYLDVDNGGYFLTSDDHETLLVREKPAYDGAEPSGNSIALNNLLRLNEFTTDDQYRVTAEKLLRTFTDRLQRSPSSLSIMLSALDYYLDKTKEIVLVTPATQQQSSQQMAEPFLRLLRKTFTPNTVLVVAAEGEDLQQQTRLVPFLEGKITRKGQVTAYVCEKGVCQLPTTDPQQFLQQVLSN